MGRVAASLANSFPNRPARKSPGGRALSSNAQLLERPETVTSPEHRITCEFPGATLVQLTLSG